MKLTALASLCICSICFGADSSAQSKALKEFNAYAQLGEFDKAVQAYQQGGPLNLGEFDLPTLALAYEQTGQSVRAIETLNRIRSADQERKDRAAKSGRGDSTGYNLTVLRKLKEAAGRMKDEAVKKEAAKLIAEFPTEQELDAKVQKAVNARRSSK